MPIRIKRERRKGWKMPADTIYVGRPSMWGNPFTGPDAVERFREHYSSEHLKSMARMFLRGKNLCCWCPLDKPCHGDVLLEISNENIESESEHD